MSFELAVIGPGARQRWSRSLNQNEVIRIGRQPERGWSVPWDPRVSREHADLIVEGGRLHVRCLAVARNPARIRGSRQRDFYVSPGEEFHIGTTLFRFLSREKATTESQRDSTRPPDGFLSETPGEIYQEQLDPEVAARMRMDRRALESELEMVLSRIDLTTDGEREQSRKRVEDSKARVDEHASSCVEISDEISRLKEKLARDAERESFEFEIEELNKKLAEAERARQEADEQLQQVINEEAERKRQEEEERRRAEEQAKERTLEAEALKIELSELQGRFAAAEIANRQTLDDAVREVREEEQRRAAEAIEKARQEVLSEAERHQAEVITLNEAMSALTAELEKQAEEHRVAEAEARRLADEEARRRQEIEARTQAEEAARRQAEDEAAQRRAEVEALRKDMEQLIDRHASAEAATKEEAESLKNALDSARAEMDRVLEAQQQAEEKVASLADEAARRQNEMETLQREEAENRRRADEEAERRQREADELRDEVQSLQVQMEAEAEAHREAEAQAVKLAEEETRRAVEQEAQEKAELEAARHKAEVSDIQSSLAQLEAEFESQLNASRQAEQKALQVAAAEAKRREEEVLRRREEAAESRKIEAENKRREQEIAALLENIDALQNSVSEHARRADEVEGRLAEIDLLRQELNEKTAAQQRAEAEAQRVHEEETRRKAFYEQQRAEAEQARTQAEAEAVERRREADGLKERVVDLNSRLSEQVEAQRDAEQRADEARERAEEETRRFTQEESLRHAEQEARLRAEEQVVEFKSLIGSLEEEVGHLKSRLDSENQARIEAEQEVGRIAALQELREQEQEARREEEDRLRNEFTLEIERRNQEATTLRERVGRLEADLLQSAEAQRVAEETAAHLAEQEEARRRELEVTRKLEQKMFDQVQEDANQRKEEAEELRGQVDQLQSLVRSEADLLRAAERQVEQISRELTNRQELDDSRRMVDRELFDKSQLEVKHHATEADRLKAEVERLQQQVDVEAERHRELAAKTGGAELAEARLKMIDVLKDDIRSSRTLMDEAIQAQRQAEEESRRLAEEMTAHQREAESRRKLAEEARRQAEAEAEKHKSERQSLVEQVSGLQTQLATISSQWQEKEAEAGRLAEQQKKRLAEEERLRKQEEEARLKAEAEADQRRREADSLLEQVAVLQSQVRSQAEAQRLVEDRAETLDREVARREQADQAREEADAAARQKAEEVAGRHAEEIESLRTRLGELQTQLESRDEPTSQADAAHEVSADRTGADDQPVGPPPDVDGTAFGEYQLLDQIARGGTGQVFKADHRSLNRTVALKILSREATRSKELVIRFQRKMQILARLNHPNLVAAFDAGERRGTWFLAMEYVRGASLHDLVLRYRQLPVPFVVNYVIQACRGLAYLHEMGAFHRNVKPGNMLVNEEGVVKLIGLGSVYFDGAPTLGKLDGWNTIIGSADYMSPEQSYDCNQIDGRSDIYSLGCTLFTALTKRLMYPVNSRRRKLLAHRFQPPPPLRQFRPDVETPLEDVFVRMVAKKPEDRFATMSDLIDALQQLNPATEPPAVLGLPERR